MKLRSIGIIYRKELIDSLRDRRTLVSMVVVPLLLMPILTIGMATFSVKMWSKVRQEIPKVMILGGEDSPRVITALHETKTIEIVPANADYIEQISDKKIRAAVEIPRDFDRKLESGKNPAVLLYIYGGEIKSAAGAERLEQFFRKLREDTVRERLLARNLPENLVTPFSIEKKNVAPPEKVGGSFFGGLIPYVLILLCMIGAMYPAMDLTAGEKERGTIETILSSPVPRTHLVFGKFLTVLTASLATAALSIISMAVSFRYQSAMISEVGGELTSQFSMTVAPKAVLAVFAMVLPVAVFLSAALLAISLFAKSFKEAQSYISPLMIIVILPAMASVLPGVELTAPLALVPILNTSLVSKELITGTFHWNYIFLIFASSCVYAAVALFAAVKLFNQEKVLFRT